MMRALGQCPSTKMHLLSERGLSVDTPARPKIGHLEFFSHDENVLWYDITVEDSVGVHMSDRLQQLVHEHLN